MRKMLLSFLFVSLTIANTHAGDINVEYSKTVSNKDKKVLIGVMKEVAGLLPESMKAKLPAKIEIKVGAITEHTSIPDGCNVLKGLSIKDAKKIKPFIYGLYKKSKNQLIINTPVVAELAKGAKQSKAINCQHKSLYNQAIATIIHELTHAYDFNNGKVSNSAEYIKRAGFKKSLFKIKNKNLEAMRSADIYEITNVAESFAVNMEYFVMDPEFFCRKPSMFSYFQNLFGVDPYPNRSCKPGNLVMVTAQQGFEAVDLDPRRVYRVDYLLASPGKAIMSGFGHSMFRIVMCAPERIDPVSGVVIAATPMGKKCLDDKMFHLVISYRASVEDAKLNLLKGLGLWGAYPSMLFMLRLSDVLDEYNRDQLRDIVAYPVALTEKEKFDFIQRAKEEHWNYRGAYKFISSNCATESYDLLKSALDTSRLDRKSSFSPRGVLRDLDALDYASVKDQASAESFKAQTEQLILSLKEAYGYRSNKEKADRKALDKFIQESTTNARMARFKKFSQVKFSDNALNVELSLLKKHLVAASSFSVMEQYFQRITALGLKQKISEYVVNSKDPRVKEIIEESQKNFSVRFNDLAKNGYGIPFKSEINLKETNEKIEAAKENTERAEAMVKEVFPKEVQELEKINKNITVYNLYSLEVRKEFRVKLELYVNQVLKNMAREETTRNMLIEAVQSADPAAILRVRNLLGADLVTSRDLLDSKLKKIIKNIL